MRFQIFLSFFGSRELIAEVIAPCEQDAIDRVEFEYPHWAGWLTT